jgi:capsid protein
MKLADRWKLVTKAFNPKAVSYDAARPSIQRRMPANARAVDSHIDVTGYDRERLMRLSRYLYNNVPLVRGMITEKARYVAGGGGIRPQARSGDDQWDAAAEAFFTQWSRVADIQGRYSWRKLCGLPPLPLTVTAKSFFAPQRRPLAIPR